MENIHQNCESKKAKERCDEPEIRFSVVTAAAGILTKRMHLKDGGVLKDSTGCRMAKGTIKTTTSTPQRFAAGLRKFKPIRAIVHGICPYDEARVVSKARLQQAQKKALDAGNGKPIIARTKEYIDYPDGPGIILFDHDKPRDNSVALDDTALKSYTPQDLIDVIIEIFPGLAGCVWVSTPSTSACIYDTKTGKELRGLGAGFHLYLFPKKATYIPRFLEVLGKRLWLAGYGRVEISRSGSLLLRTIIDLSVGSPERLDFVAGAVCKDGLEQRLPEPEYKPGALLDTQALLDLTEEEETQYQRLLEQVKEKAGSALETVRTEYVDQEAGKLVQASDGKLNIDNARTIIEARQNQSLEDDDILNFAHLKGRGVSVREVLDASEQYHGKSLADPLEPEYDGGSMTKARFYWNDGNSPIIHSFCHGSIKYTFERFVEKVINFDEVLPDILERTATDCGAPFEPDALEILARLTREDKGRFMRVRNKIKNINRAVILGELDKDIYAFSRMNRSFKSSSPSSSSLSISYHSPCPSLEEKVLHIQRALVVTDRENEKLVPQSEAAALFAAILDGLFAFSMEGLRWYKFDGYWLECPATEFDSAVTYMLYVGAGDLGFSNSYESGVVSLLQKRGQNRLPVPQPGMIPFQNGLLDFLSDELISATPKNASTWILPFDYEKNAHCPNFLDWLKTSVDGDEETILLLRAWINALLTGRPDLQVFLHLIGPAGTGKSTFGRVVFVLVGDENATTTSLKQLETNRFEAANIFGKRLTAIEEADKYGGSVSVLKAMTGQDPLRLERKNQQQQGSFIYGGQTLMMSNERLATTDYTSGIERRRITVEFKRRLTQGERAAWAERGGEAKILHSEAPGIINWALGLSYEKVNDVFKAMPERIRRANLDAARFNNPLVDWMLKSLIPDPDAATQIGSKGEYRLDGCTFYKYADERLYPNYLTWCQQSGREKVSLQRFSGAIIDAVATYGAHVYKQREKDGTKMYGLRIRLEHEESWLTYIERPDGVKKQMNTGVKDNLLEMQEMNKVNTFCTTSSAEKGTYSLADSVHQDKPQYVEVEI